MLKRAIINLILIIICIFSLGFAIKMQSASDAEFPENATLKVIDTDAGNNVMRKDFAMYIGRHSTSGWDILYPSRYSCNSR